MGPSHFSKTTFTFNPVPDSNDHMMGSAVMLSYHHDSNDDDNDVIMIMIMIKEVAL